MRGLNCRYLRLDLVAGLGIALALALLPAAAAAQQIATHTTLTVETSEQSGHTQATATVAVTAADGLPASGVVVIEDGDRELAEAVLNAQGVASPVFSLPAGDHDLRAVYAGDASHLSSASATSNVTAQASSTPSFSLSLAPVAPSTLPLTLTAGNAGTIAVTVVPEDNAALTAPMFVTLSCSGLPSVASCTFTPESVEILPTTPASCPSGSRRVGLPACQLHAASNRRSERGQGRAARISGKRRPPRRLGHSAAGYVGPRWTGVGCAPAALVAAPGARGT